MQPNDSIVGLGYFSIVESNDSVHFLLMALLHKKVVYSKWVIRVTVKFLGD